jgi:hypothetical protein
LISFNLVNLFTILLKSIGIDPSEIANAGKKVLANKIREKLEPKEKAATEAAEVAQMNTNDAVNTLSNDNINAAGLTLNQPGKNISTKKYIPYILGGGLAIYLLTRKK